MALRDRDPSAIHLASPAQPQPGRHLVAIQQQQLGLGEHRSQVWAVPEIGTVRAAMLAAGDRARGIVVVHRPGSDLGHAFNVVRHTIGGRPAVSFLDGQTGTVARLPRDAALHFLPLTPDITPDDRAVPVPADALGQVGILDPAAPADPPTAPSADPAESAGQPAPSATA